MTRFIQYIIFSDNVTAVEEDVDQQRKTGYCRVGITCTWWFVSVRVYSVWYYDKTRVVPRGERLTYSKRVSVLSLALTLIPNSPSPSCTNTCSGARAVESNTPTYWSPISTYIYMYIWLAAPIYYSLYCYFNYLNPVFQISRAVKI